MSAVWGIRDWTDGAVAATSSNATPLRKNDTAPKLDVAPSATVAKKRSLEADDDEEEGEGRAAKRKRLDFARDGPNDALPRVGGGFWRAFALGLS